MENIYRHRWMIGKNYYEVRGKLLKEGFKIIEYNKDWKKTKKGKILFSDDVCKIRVHTTIYFNLHTGHWNCGTVTEIHEWTED